MTRVARALLCGVSSLLVSVGLVTAPASAASRATISAPRTSVMVGESFTVMLRTGTAVKRPVVLQVRSGSRWKTWTKRTTRSSGNASVTTSTRAAKRVFRTYAPAATVAGRRYPARTSARLTVRTERQSATLTLTVNGAGEVTAQGAFGPARQGRKTSLQQWVGGSWRTVASGRPMNARGVVSYGSVGTRSALSQRAFRVYAWRWKGAAQVTSASRAVPSPDPAEPPPSIVAAEPVAHPSDGSVTLGASVTGAVTEVRFFVDGRKVGSATGAPWQVTWAPVRGTHDLVARAFGPGGTAISDSVAFTQSADAVDADGDLPPGFATQDVQAGFDLPTSFSASATGSVFVIEKAGRVLLLKPDPEGGYGAPVTVADFTGHVLTNDDRGMTGLVVDPRYGDDTGHDFVYVSYVHADAGDPADDRWQQAQQVQRIDLNGWAPADGPRPYVEANVILGRVTGPSCHDEANLTTPDCVPMIGGSHTIGDLAFDDDGFLLVAVGDGSVLFGPFADRTQALRAQNPQILAGKVLRIDPATGRGVPGNPWFGDALLDAAQPGTSNASRVVAMGFRYPFRISVGPDGQLLVGDVGESTTEEVNVVHVEDADEGVPNFGWPCYEGNARSDFSTAAPGSDWSACEALWARGDDAVTWPVHTYAHDSDGGSITGGVVYTGDVYPADYQGAYFFGDYAQNFMRTGRFDDLGDLGSVSTFIKRGAAGGPVKIGMGPDGLLWYISIYEGSIKKITYSAASSAPTCPTGTFRTTYYDLTDSGLANDDDPVWGALPRLQATSFGAQPDAAGGCVDQMRLDRTFGSPAESIPADRFGIRWEGRVRSDGGTYELALDGHDWFRVWIDNQTLVTPEGTETSGGVYGYGVWKVPPLRFSLPPGLHTVRVEFVHDKDEAWADASLTRVGGIPAAAFDAPDNAEVVGKVAGGNTSGEVQWSVDLASAGEGADLSSAKVYLDLVHVTGAGAHIHPSGDRTFALSGRADRVSGTFHVDDHHANGNSAFRLRTQVTDADGNTGWAAPRYVCLTGNDVGLCATS